MKMSGKQRLNRDMILVFLVLACIFSIIALVCMHSALTQITNLSMICMALAVLNIFFTILQGLRYCINFKFTKK